MGDEEGGRLHITNRSLQSSLVLTGEDPKRLTGRSNPRTNLRSLSCSVFSCCEEVMVVVVVVGTWGVGCVRVFQASRFARTELTDR